MKNMMANIYQFSCYREYLSKVVEVTKGTVAKISLSDLSETMSMHKSTFSKVMNFDMDLNTDAIYLLSKFLKLNSEEETYLQLLVAKSSTGLEKRKKEIEKIIRDMQKKHLDTAKVIDAPGKDIDTSLEEEYYMSPWAPIIHVFLTISKYQSRPELIPTQLGILPTEFQRNIRLLKKMGLVVALEGGKLAAAEKLFHPTKKDHQVMGQHLLTRAVMNQRLASIPLTERYGLSVTYSADANTQEEIRQRIIAVVGDIQKNVQNAKPENVYHMSIDVFGLDE